MPDQSLAYHNSLKIRDIDGKMIDSPFIEGTKFFWEDLIYALKEYEKLYVEDILYLWNNLNDELKLEYERKVKRMKIVSICIDLIEKKENKKNKKELNQKENKDNILLEENEILDLNDAFPLDNKEEFENIELEDKKEKKSKKNFIENLEFIKPKSVPKAFHIFIKEHKKEILKNQKMNKNKRFNSISKKMFDELSLEEKQSYNLKRQMMLEEKKIRKKI